jgi:hypothetical protein
MSSGSPDSYRVRGISLPGLIQNVMSFFPSQYCYNAIICVLRCIPIVSSGFICKLNDNCINIFVLFAWCDFLLFINFAGNGAYKIGDCEMSLVAISFRPFTVDCNHKFP